MTDEANVNSIGTVKIDKYVLKTEKSPKIIIFDNELQKNIVSVNTLVAENNLALAQMILLELNTGKYEPVDEDIVDDEVVDDEVDDSPSMNSDGELGND